MKTIKLMFLQSMMISSGVLFIIAVSSTIFHFMGYDTDLPWYVLISIFLSGILCSIPSLIWKNKDELDKKQFIKRLILHFFCVYAIIITMGFIFKWYDSLASLAGISISFVLVYFFVWAGTYWLTKKEDKEINEALNSIRDEE